MHDLLTAQCPNIHNILYGAPFYNSTPHENITHSYSKTRKSVTDLEELEPSQQVIDVAAQRFEGGVGLLHPESRNLSLQYGVGNLLQLCRHHHQPLDGLPDVDEAASDHINQSVETHHLLHQHCVHALHVSAWFTQWEEMAQ